MRENRTSVFTEYKYTKATVRSLCVPSKIAEEMKLKHKDRVCWVVNEDGSATIRRVK